jgi:hypothetical protein
MRLCLALAALMCAFPSPFASAETCPVLVDAASRLVLVTVPTLTSSAGRLRLFERPRADADWRQVGPAEPVTLGIRGIAWGHAFRHLAGNHEPAKTEGDKRTPAGIFAIGRPFGFAPSPLAGYLQLGPDTVCVDDPSSPAYNTITSRKAVSRLVSHEKMQATALYRRGLVVDYPTDAANRAGSCIFIHIWKSPASGTVGCIALPESRVAVLQAFANEHPTLLAVVPDSAVGRLANCLPATAGDPNHDNETAGRAR